MHEKRFWQHVDDRIGGWIKEPIVVTEENLMERNEKAVKADSHQNRKSAAKSSPLKRTNQAPLLLFCRNRLTNQILGSTVTIITA